MTGAGGMPPEFWEVPPLEPQREEPAPTPIPTAVLLVDCWRCGKSIPNTHTRCPYCRARFTSPTEPTTAAASPALVPLIWFFALLLVSSLIFGWLQHFGIAQQRVPNRAQLQSLLNHILILEAVDVVIVGLAWIWLYRTPSLATPAAGDRTAAWVVAVPVLAAMLVVNVAYHWLLRTIVGVPLERDQLVAEFGTSGWLWLAMCIQPAIAEEFFFRYLALGTLRSVMGMTGAVVISAVMFGMAHIGVPLSIPYLTLLGIILGYARVFSGGLLLPMFLHFIHNAAVLWIDTWL